jgi:polyisoprenoid-binding protein YceI
MATIELGPQKGRLLIKTGRSGLGRRAGHDLTIEATRWSGTLTLAGDATRVADATADGSSVRVTVAVDGLTVREGTGGLKPLTDQDRLKIAEDMRDVLEADRYPDITFVSTRVHPTATGATVEGELTVRDRSEPLQIELRAENDRILGAATVKQTLWGIKPYSAFMGALKLADDVGVEFDLQI